MNGPGFDFGWMMGGILIAACGGAIVVFYKQISDILANGVSSYEHVKLFGVITIIVGLIFAANMHIYLLQFIVGLFS